MTAPRPSRPGDESSLRQLWKTVFGDSDEFLDRFFSLVYTPGMAAVIEEEGEIVSAAYALPLENAAYIFAVATHPNHRGKGHGKVVTLAAAGGKPAYLYPAETSLRGWYAREMGAQTVSFRPRWPVSETLRPIAPAEYQQRREELLRDIPHAVYTLPLLELFTFAGEFYETEKGVCAMENGIIKESLPCPTDGEPFVMGLNNAPPMYWGLVFD